MSIFRPLLVLMIFLIIIGNIASSSLIIYDDEEGFSGIPIGDILFMDVRPLWIKLLKLPFNPGVSNDHAALSLGGDIYVEADNYTIFQVVSYLDGVQIHSKAWLNLFFYNFSCACVDNASSEQRLGAVRFALSQIGCPYQNPYEEHFVYDSWHANFDPADESDPYSDWWYCSELTWASYFHQGINIDATPEKILDDDGKYYFKLCCDDIRNSSNVSLYSYGG